MNKLKLKWWPNSIHFWETLHPHHKVSKLYRFLKNVYVAHHVKVIAFFNKHDSEKRDNPF